MWWTGSASANGDGVNDATNALEAEAGVCATDARALGVQQETHDSDFVTEKLELFWGCPTSARTTLSQI